MEILWNSPTTHSWWLMISHWDQSGRFIMAENGFVSPNLDLFSSWERDSCSHFDPYMICSKAEYVQEVSNGTCGYTWGSTLNLWYYAPVTYAGNIWGTNCYRVHSHQIPTFSLWTDLDRGFHGYPQIWWASNPALPNTGPGISDRDGQSNAQLTKKRRGAQLCLLRCQDWKFHDYTPEN